MKIEEIKQDLKVEITPLSCDDCLKYYDKKTNTHKKADWIDKTPIPNRNSVILLSGQKGSGKTTTALSLLCAKNENRVFRGCFDTVLVCCPPSTYKSLKENPFECLPEQQIFHEFNESVLDQVLEIAETNSMEDKDTCFLLDDAGDKLRSSKRIADKLSGLVIKHRHLHLTLMILVQEIMMIHPTIRSNCDILIKYRPINAKREKIFHEEYFSEMSSEEYGKLNSYLYQKKGDFLMVKFGIPRKYYKNFNELKISGLDNEYKEGIEKGEEKKAEKSETGENGK